jgi:hypothetical protein
VTERAAAKSAAEWREFWRAHGMRELRSLLRAAWRPLAAAPEADDASFRIASLLGSRASAAAIADELGRIRRDTLGLEPAPGEDAQTAERIAAWFEAAGP